jgi:hypothetical protein
MANKEPDTTPLLDLFLLAVFIFSLAQRSEIIQKDKILQELHFSTAYVWNKMLYQEKDKGTVTPLFKVDQTTAKEKLAALSPKSKTHIMKIKLGGTTRQTELQDLCRNSNIYSTLSRSFFFHVDKNGNVQYTYSSIASLTGGIKEKFTAAVDDWKTAKLDGFIVLLDKEAPPAVQQEVRKCISQSDEKITLLMIERQEQQL